MPSVLITGASGFIARHLAYTLRQSGLEVLGLSRKFNSVDGFSKIFNAHLGDSLYPILKRERIDVVIHCALDTSKASYQINTSGTLQWLNEFIDNKVPLQILLSSLSAEPDAASDYGRAKFFLENEFRNNGQIVLRLGLVIGNGGMFSNMVQTYKRSPIVPLLDSGRSYVYILGIDTLVNIIRDCILMKGDKLRGKSWNIQQPTYYRLREVIEVIKDEFGFRTILFPVPSTIILRTLKLAEKLGIPGLPISSQNIEGLIQRGEKEVLSDYSIFGYPEEELEELVKKAKIQINNCL